MKSKYLLLGKYTEELEREVEKVKKTTRNRWLPSLLAYIAKKYTFTLSVFGIVVDLFRERKLNPKCAFIIGIP